MSVRLLETAWMLAIVVVLALIMYALTGCAAPGACVRPIVTLTRPDLPTVPAADLQSLRDDTYRALALRDVLLHQYAEECEVIVRELAEVP